MAPLPPPQVISTYHEAIHWAKPVAMDSEKLEVKKTKKMNARDRKKQKRELLRIEFRSFDLSDWIGS